MQGSGTEHGSRWEKGQQAAQENAAGLLAQTRAAGESPRVEQPAQEKGCAQTDEEEGPAPGGDVGPGLFDACLGGQGPDDQAGCRQVGRPGGPGSPLKPRQGFGKDQPQMDRRGTA